MQINEIMEQLLLIDLVTYASMVALIIAITKGITEFFNIVDKITKLIITVGVTLFLSVMIFIVPTVEQQAITAMLVLQMLSTVILIFFGASGIYQFLPSTSNEVEEDEEYEEEVQ